MTPQLRADLAKVMEELALKAQQKRREIELTKMLAVKVISDSDRVM